MKFALWVCAASALCRTFSRICQVHCAVWAKELQHFDHVVEQPQGKVKMCDKMHKPPANRTKCREYYHTYHEWECVMAILVRWVENLSSFSALWVSGVWGSTPPLGWKVPALLAHRLQWNLSGTMRLSHTLSNSSSDNAWRWLPCCFVILADTMLHFKKEWVWVQ